MNNSKFSLNACFCSLLSMLIIGYGAIASAACEPRAAVRAFIAEDYERAVKANNECLESFRAGGSIATGQRWMDESRFAYHLATGSQIAAEMGQLQAARDMLDQAKGYFAANSTFLIASSEILNLTEGFLLEMRGDTYEAEQFYLQNRDQHTLARLAVLAMHRHDYPQAISWAAQSLKQDPLNLTARIVLAASARSTSLDMTTAKELNAAMDNESAPGNNQFMPACYAEVWWAAVSLRETGTVGAPPEDD